MYRLKDLREDMDLSQKEVAKVLKMSQTGYSKYECGTNDIPTIILIKLSNFYDVSVDYILGITNVKSRNADSEKLGKEVELEKEAQSKKVKVVA